MYVAHFETDLINIHLAYVKTVGIKQFEKQVVCDTIEDKRKRSNKYVWGKQRVFHEAIQTSYFL